MTSTRLLRLINAHAVRSHVRPAVDPSILPEAARIVEDVRVNGLRAVRKYAECFDDLPSDQPIVYDRDEMMIALDSMSASDRALLERTTDRIRTFAMRQRAAVDDVRLSIPGGVVGHTVVPIESAGCYAPAGRVPLPSTVLMTAVTARAAGCRRVVVVSPGARPQMLAAAAIAGADSFLALGGAHAVAAIAFGFGGFDRCDVLVGPGNAWVTAAKHIVSAVVGIDMLAGPSELLVIADDSADPSVVAADLLAQAEHDSDAVPILVSTSMDLIDAVDEELESQLQMLDTAKTARAALLNGFVVYADSLDEAIRASDAVAPEHLQLMTRDARSVAARIRHAGAIFIGEASAEVLGDYGAGPNHTLPTGGTARFRAGLSVHTFLRMRTWLEVTSPDAARDLIDDARALAAMEGLPGHAAAASRRGSE